MQSKDIVDSKSRRVVHDQTESVQARKHNLDVHVRTEYSNHGGIVVVDAGVTSFELQFSFRSHCGFRDEGFVAVCIETGFAHWIVFGVTDGITTGALVRIAVTLVQLCFLSNAVNTIDNT